MGLPTREAEKKLIKETWKWVHDDLGLTDEVDKVAEAFVKPDGTYAYED